LITKITGQLAALRDDSLTLRVDAFEHEVLIPEFTRRQLQGELNQEISLHTIEYLEGNPMQGRMTPRLIGFLTEVEREFFELFCSVDGVGVKKALRAMVRPVKEVATSIEEQDAKGLSALPGIGPAMAERIIAKLRRKVPKFARRVRDPARRGFRGLRGAPQPRALRERRPGAARRRFGDEGEVQRRAVVVTGDLSAEPEITDAFQPTVSRSRLRNRTYRETGTICAQKNRCQHNRKTQSIPPATKIIPSGISR